MPIASTSIGDDAEAAGSDQRSERVANVLNDALERREGPHLAGLLLERRDIAELTGSRQARLVRRKTGALPLFLAHRQVKRELVVDFTGRGGAGSRELSTRCQTLIRS